MKGNVLIGHYKKTRSAFRRHLKKTTDRQKAENIHLMRVSVKKLRAVFSLMEVAAKESCRRKTHLAVYKKLFKAAGKVREAQLNLELVKKYTKYDTRPYQVDLKRIQKTAARELDSELKKFDFSKEQTNSIELIKQMQQFTNQQIASTAARYTAQKLKKAKKLRRKIDDPAKLHKIRIHLKSASEMLSLLNEIVPNPKLASLQATIKLLTRATGKWHDYLVLTSSLKRFPRSHAQAAAKNSLDQLIEKIERQNEKRKSKIKKLLDQIDIVALI